MEIELEKENKVVKSYSLPPAQVAWLRERAKEESTGEKTISASNVLERIIEKAMESDAAMQKLLSKSPRRVVAA